MRRITLLILIAFSLLTACSTSKPLYNSYTSVGVKDNDIQIMRTAIIESLGFKQWRILDEGPNMFRAGIDVRTHYAEIKITFDATQFEITYVRSRNLDYKSSKKSIHRNYNRWIQYLEQEIKARVQTKNYTN